MEVKRANTERMSDWQAFCWGGSFGGRRFSNWSSGTCDSPSLATTGRVGGKCSILRTFQKRKNCSMSGAVGFLFCPLCRTRQGRRDGGVLFYSNGPCGKLTLRTGIFSKFRRETGSGTKGGPCGTDTNQRKWVQGSTDNCFPAVFCHLSWILLVQP